MFHAPLLSRKRRRRSVHGHEQDEVVKPSSASKESHSVQQHPVLQMQQQLGNRATQMQLQREGMMVGSTLIQRMPSSATVEKTLGKPKEDTKERRIGNKVVVKGKLQSTKYKAVLAALRDYESYLLRNYLGTNESNIRPQMMEVHRLLGVIYSRMSAYEGGKNNKKSRYMLQHRHEVKEAQGIIARAFLKKLENPGHAMLRPSLNSFVISALQNGGMPDAPIELQENQQTGSESGGSKTVDKFDMGGGQEGYFKDQKNTLTPSLEGPKWEVIHENLVETYRLKREKENWDLETYLGELGKARLALMNEYNLGVDALGINPEDARMSQRDIAMSRLDQLLGTHIIARAQFAIVHMEDGGTREGSIMAAAEGYSPKQVIDKETDLSGQERKQARGEEIGMGDPMLMQQLSRLQMIDLIAGQVDRNVGNYFIKRDENDNIVGITGIDNDMAFGTKITDFSERVQEMVGVSRYVDKEVAEAIIALDPTLVEAILSDLLPEDEIQTTLTRLQNLQMELSSELTNLLEPHEWVGYAQHLLNENKSYYASLNNKL